VALAALVAAPAVGSTFYGASSVHAFGDSLTDAGRVYKLTFKRFPESPPYWKGRFSDGRVWAEHVETEVRDAGVSWSNRAYGGAKARTDGDIIPDLRRQTRDWRDLPSARRGPAPTALVAIGANDVLDRAGKKDVTTVARKAANAVATETRWLLGQGVERAWLFGLPDLGAIPKFAGREGRAASARAGADAFDARLRQHASDLAAEGHDVRFFDLRAAVDSVFAAPEIYGITDTTTPCLVNGKRCKSAVAARKAYFDNIHPTASLHGAIAKIVLADFSATYGTGATLLAGVAPLRTAAPASIPLPAPAALLACALLLLGLAARRRPVLVAPATDHLAHGGPMQNAA
jgi:outer membrane lipase/esterase